MYIYLSIHTRICFSEIAKQLVCTCGDIFRFYVFLLVCFVTRLRSPFTDFMAFPGKSCGGGSSAYSLEKSHIC